MAAVDTARALPAPAPQPSHGFADGVLALLVGLQCRRWIPRLGLAGSVWRAAWISLAAGLASALGMAVAALATVAVVWTLVRRHGDPLQAA